MPASPQSAGSAAGGGRGSVTHRTACSVGKAAALGLDVSVVF